MRSFQSVVLTFFSVLIELRISLEIEQKLIGNIIGPNSKFSLCSLTNSELNSEKFNETQNLSHSADS